MTRKQRQSKRPRACDRRAHHDDDQDPLVIHDRQRDLAGTIYRVPDGWWGFWAPGRDEHPGLCIACDAARNLAIMLKGTDGTNPHKSYRGAFLITPTSANGLRKPTAFDLWPRVFRFRRLVLLDPERRIGVLDPDDLFRLMQEIERFFSPETDT